MPNFFTFVLMRLINGIRESQLIDRLREGDVTAFELLFRHYYPGLVIYATNFALTQPQAEEVVQEFFIRIWEKHNSINQSDSLKSYFFQSIKNRTLNVLRKQKVKDEYLEELKREAEEDLIFDPDVYVDSELQHKIQQAVNALPERCKEVFMMSRFQGYSNDEIADVLGISKRTVETQISKALKTLREELRDYAGLLLLLDLWL
ncbi:RNA polymerase sigma-70 factor [Puteibacter caeruleilacunae]|nr:RNA polymerase sigma-70 factor [Puteibacter caeruleilacunae]